MKCPNCETTLTMAERQGVEIDYCPKCRGVWLDKGELDKLITKNVSYEAEHRVRYNDHDDRNYTGKRKRKESFMEDIFDF